MAFSTLGRRAFTRGLAAAAALSTANVPRPALAAEPPTRGGRLRIALQETASSSLLDPTRVASWTVYFAYELVGETLVGVDPNLQPVPRLAESWEPVNGRVDDWVFRLRSGVTFHNGKDFVAKDVIYSLNRLRDPANQSPLRVLVEHIAEMVEVDSRTIRFTLSRPDADFPLALAQSRFFMLPNGYEDFAQPIGTGAFMADGLDPATVNVYRRNPDYWQSGKPYLDEIAFQGNPDAIARVSALLAGDVDAIQTISFSLAERVRSTGGFDVIAAQSGVHNTLVMRTTRPPFDNADVRNAMKHLLDRELLRQRLTAGFADIGNDHPVPPLSPFYHTELPVRPYDPDRARSLIQRAGIDINALILHASDAVTPGVAVDFAQIFANQAQVAGVAVQPRRDPVAGYWDNVWLNEPFMISGWGTRIIPDTMLRVAYRTGARWNEADWATTGIDRMMDDAVATSDFDRRRDLYWAIQEAIHQNGGTGIPLFFNHLDAVSSAVQGVAPNPVGSLKGWDLHNIWLDPHG